MRFQPLFEAGFPAASAQKLSEARAVYVGVFQRDGIDVDVFFHGDDNANAVAVSGGLKPQVFLPKSLEEQPFYGAEILAALLDEAVALWKAVGPSN